jgi:hypothetical protein
VGQFQFLKGASYEQPRFPRSHDWEELGYLHSTEEVPMTLQIGLVGTDGIVLASDEKTVFFDEIQTGGLTCKFLSDATRLIAFSGYEISRKVAQRIMDNEEIQDFEGQRSEVERLASDVCQEPFEDLVAPARSDGELFIVSKGRSDRFYSLYVNPKSKNFFLSPRKDKAVAGHKLNSAVFFLERYYRKSSVSELALLAAHVILQGHELNYAGIEGLEIFVCNKEGFHLQPTEILEALVAKSQKLDSQLRDLFKQPFPLSFQVTREFPIPPTRDR